MIKYIHRAARLGTLLSVFVLGLACERANMLEEDGNAEATLSTIQARIFDTNCALSGCHAGANPRLDLSLEDGLSFSNIVGVESVERSDLLRVDPGNPDASYLLKKVRGDADIVSARMPLGRDALSDADIDLIAQWIDDGALDN